MARSLRLSSSASPTALGPTMSINAPSIPSAFIAMLPYIATIVAVAGLVGKVRAPAADGEPYVKE